MKKILIVDDEKQLVGMIKIRLEASNYEVVLAYSGEEGLISAEQEKPDLLLLDIAIPKIDGLTVCKKLKDSQETKDIPIIILSASGTRDSMEKGLTAGADDFVMKPFDSKVLLDKIATLINK